MPGNRDHFEIPAIQLQPGTFANALSGLRYALVFRGEDRQGGPALTQRRHAATVVRVVMGQQDACRPHAQLGGGQDGGGIARVHDDGVALIIHQGPDVVVFERGQGSQAHRAWSSGWAVRAGRPLQSRTCLSRHSAVNPMPLPGSTR